MLLVFKELYELHDDQTVALEDLRQFCAGFINWAMPDSTDRVSTCTCRSMSRGGSSC